MSKSILVFAGYALVCAAIMQALLGGPLVITFLLAFCAALCGAISALTTGRRRVGFAYAIISTVFIYGIMFS